MVEEVVSVAVLVAEGVGVADVVWVAVGVAVELGVRDGVRVAVLECVIARPFAGASFEIGEGFFLTGGKLADGRLSEFFSTLCQKG